MAQATPGFSARQGYRGEGPRVAQRRPADAQSRIDNSEGPLNCQSET
eukprot:COSAG02_NODE_44863_length_362_cov_0.798479_1_plen_46_part_01